SRTPSCTGHRTGLQIPSTDVFGLVVGVEDRLKHVPVLGVLGDHPLEDPGQFLSGVLDASGSALPRGRGDLVVDTDVPPGAVVPEGDRHERGPGAEGERRRTRGHPGALPEELDLQTGALDVAV